MRKGIGVSPGVVVGVAHRVESVFGSFEQQTLDSPSLVPAEIERFERALAEAAADYEACVRNVAQEVGDSEAEIFKSHLQIVNDPSLRSKVRSLIENQRLTALSALAGGDEQLRRPVRPDQAGDLSRADERHPRRDLDDRVALEPADVVRHADPAGRFATATATNP